MGNNKIGLWTLGPSDAEKWLREFSRPIVTHRKTLPRELIVVSNWSTPLFNVTRHVIRRISSSPVVHSESLQLSFEIPILLSAAVTLKTDCLSTRVLCLCGGRGVVDLWFSSTTSFAAFFNCGFSALRFCGVLRCICCCFFSGLVLLNRLLHLLLFLLLLGLYLAFQLGSFLFLCGFSSPSSVSEFPRADLIHSNPLLL